MKIGGLQPVTLLDYPEKVAATIFTSGCNMRCPFCYNSNLVLPELIEKSHLMTEEEVIDFLKRRKKYLDGVCVTGGEPLIQPDIVNFCQQLKKIGYSVKIDTNGLMPEVLKKLIEKKLVDYIAMDIKGPIKVYEKFTGIKNEEFLAKINLSIKIIKKSGLDYEFRSTLVKGLHKKNDVIKMAEMIKGAKKYFLQTFQRPSRLVQENLQGSGFTKKEMEQLTKSAGQFVKFCGFRF